jgi:hypothetical protein
VARFTGRPRGSAAASSKTILSCLLNDLASLDQDVTLALDDQTRT